MGEPSPDGGQGCHVQQASHRRSPIRDGAPAPHQARAAVDEVAPEMTGQGLTLVEVCAYDRPYGEFQRKRCLEPPFLMN